MKDQLLIEKTAAVTALTLNRPKKANALHAATVADSRAEDLADLVRSAIEPGLKERIREYRKG